MRRPDMEPSAWLGRMLGYVLLSMIVVIGIVLILAVGLKLIVWVWSW